MQVWFVVQSKDTAFCFSTCAQLDAGKKLQQLHRRQLQLQHSVVVVQVRAASVCSVALEFSHALCRLFYQAAVATLEARANAVQ
jgi:hypothetical protein